MNNAKTSEHAGAPLSAILIFEGFQWVLHEGRNTIGRHEDNAFVLQGESISNHHAVITGSHGSLVIEDLGSTNGTSVNGVTIEDSVLNNGDVIKFGDIQARLSIKPSAASANQTFKDRLAQAGRSAGSNLKTAAIVAKKQAERKKLELVNLREADIVIGQRAYAEKLLTEPYASIHTSIDVINQEIDLKSQKQVADPQATMGEKAKNVAIAAKDRGLLEAALLKRNQLFQSLGSKIRQEQPTFPALLAEIQAAQAIVRQQEVLTGEIDALNAKSHSLVKSPWLIIGIAAFLLVVALAYQFTKEDPVTASTRQIMAQVEADQAKFIAERNKEIKEIEAQSKRTQLERDQIDLKLKKEAEQKALALEEANAQSELQRKAVRDKRDREAQASKDAQMQRDKEREEQLAMTQKAKADKEQAQQEEKIQEQQKRQTFAEKLFTSFAVEPQVLISPSLLKLGTTVEVKGEALDSFKALRQNKDWLGIYNVATRLRAKELPDESSLQYAIRDLNKLNLSLILKTPYKPGPEEDRIYMVVAGKGDGEVLVVKADGYPKEHPDKIGYLYRWSPQEEHVFVFQGDKETSSKVDHLYYRYHDQLKALETKLKLTELNKDQHQAAVIAEGQKLLQTLTLWTQGQTESTDIKEQQRFARHAIYENGQWKVLPDLKDASGTPLRTDLFAHVNGETYATVHPDSPAYFPETQTQATLVHWTGTKWEPVDISPTSRIDSMVAFQGKLYLGGTLALTQGKAQLAAWNGQTWEIIEGPRSFSVNNLNALEDGLYIGGAGTAQKWDGKTMSAVSEVPLKAVNPRAFARNASSLIVAGHLWPKDKELAKTGSSLSGNLYTYSAGEWKTFPAPYMTNIMELLTLGDYLYVLEQGELHRYTFSTGSWDWPTFPVELKSGVTAITLMDGKLVAAGHSDLLFIDGEKYEKLPVEIQGIKTLSVKGDQLFIAGSFNQIRFLCSESTAP